MSRTCDERQVSLLLHWRRKMKRLLKPAAVCVEVLAHAYLCKEERGKSWFHKLKEDNLATFPFLSFFFFFFSRLPLLLVQSGEGRMSAVSRWCWATERRRRVSLGWQLHSAWTCLFPKAFLLHTELFLCFFFSLLEYKTLWNWPKRKKKFAGVLEMSLNRCRTSEQEMKLSVGLMFFKWVSPLTALFLNH